MKKSILIPTILIILSVIIITATVNFPGQATDSKIRLKVLGQNQFLSGGPASLRIITMDEKTQEPLEGIETIVKFIKDDKGREFFTGTTDEQGTVEANFIMPSDIEGKGQLKIIAISGGEEESLTVDISVKKSYQLLLTTDKPLYQPGQTINLRLLALSRANMQPVEKIPVTFEIEDAKGNKVFKKTETLSEFGVASAKFTLADEVNMGEYHIKALVEKEETEKNVTVKRYVLPKFNNTVKTDKDYYQPGESLKGSVDSQYFFGKPVTDAEVVITFSTFDVAVTKLSEITGKTDKNGLYSFEYTLPEYFTGLPLDEGTAYLDMEIKVTDNAKHQEITYKSLPVVQNPIQITVVPEKSTLLPEVENTVYILTSYPDGSPASTTLEFTLNENKQKIKTDDMGFAEITVEPSEEPEEGQNINYNIHCYDDKGNTADISGTLQTDYGDSVLLRTDRALYRVGENIKITVLTTKDNGTAYLDIVREGQTILTKSLRIKDGKGSLDWSLAPDCAGSLTLHAYRITPLGQIIRDSQKIVVSPANDLKIDISFNKDKYLPGEDSEITFKVVDKNGKPSISVIGVDIVDESLFALADRKPGFEKLYFLLEEELLEPKYEIHGIEFSDIITRFEEGDEEDDTQKLSEVILKDAPQNEPFTLKKDSFLESLKTLYNNFNVVYNAMYNYYYQENKYPADVSDMIEREILSKENSLDPWGNPIHISGGGGSNYPELISPGPDGKEGTDDDINYNNIYALLQENLPGDDPFWNEMGWFGVEEEEMLMDGAFNLQAAGTVPGAPPIASPSVATTGDSEGGGVSEPPARIREYFPETLYTNPEVLTDEKGTATVNVTMADSITTWRLTSFASSLKGEMGNRQDGITVFQDFFADIDLPVFLTQDDEISIPIAVYNYLPAKQTVKLELLKEDWFTLLEDDNVKNITLEKDQVSVVYFRIKAKDVGLHPLTIYATGSEMSDAIKRNIQIEPNGKMFLTTESDRLEKSLERAVDIPEKAIPGASKILVTIYPGLFSQVVEGLDKIFRMPGGCFEQTSATTYPNVLVLDYMRRTDKVTPELEMKAETYINNGYQRLLTFEVSGGGFSWFGDAPANKLLTAFGLMEFKDMEKVHEIDDTLISRTQEWLASQQEADGSWSPDESYLHAESWSRLQNSNLLVTAYITWGLLDTGYENKEVTDKAVEYIKKHYQEADDPYMLSVIANALASSGTADAELKEVFDMLLEKKMEKGETIYWESALESITYSTGISSTIETTAMVAYAMLKSESHPDTVNKCITFLIQNKDGYGTWHSTQPTILTLRTLLLAAEKSEEGINASGSILINGKKFKDFDITPENFDVYQQFDLGVDTVEGNNKVEIKFEGKGNCLYQIVTRYYMPWDTVEVDDKLINALSIDVTYDKTRLEQNDTVTCKAKVTNNTGGDVKMTIIDLGIPPGFSVESEGLEKLVENKVIQKYSLTGRQIIIYIEEILTDKSVEISYDLRAKYPVKVQAPRSQVYEYYKPENTNSTEPVELVVE